MKLTNKTVPINALRISELNWKRDITEDDVEDLAQNIDEVGNLHPIIVRPVGKAGRMFEVLAGRRRLEAQKLLGGKKVDVRVVRCDDIQAEIISYSENLKVKKPNTKEWSVGVKRLVELFEKRQKIGIPKSGKSPKKVDTSDAEYFCDAASKKCPRGRPKSGRAQAIKDAAKSVGASQRSVYRAVKREEDLIPTAARSLRAGKITQEQANLLATMSKKNQQRQFPEMVRETRDQTRRRLSVEKLQHKDDKEAAIFDMLGSALLDCKDLDKKLDTTIRALGTVKLKKKQYKKIPNYEQAENVRDSLNDLLRIMEGK